MTNFGIGKLLFSLEPDPAVFDELRPRTYRRFVREARPDDLRVEVAIRPGSTSLDTSSASALFAMPRYWSLYEKGGLRFLAVDPESVPEPFSVALFDPHADSVEIVYSESLRDSLPPGDTLQHPFEHPVDRLLTSYFLSRRDGLLCHACGARFGGWGYLFPGVSTAGKSTLARLLMSPGSSGWSVLSDERLAVCRAEEGFQVFGTPWHGDLPTGDPEGADLRGLIFLTQALRDEIMPINRDDALSRFLRLVSVAWYDEEVMQRQLKTVERLVSTVPCFELAFRPTSEVVDLLTAFADRHNPTAP